METRTKKLLINKVNEIKNVDSFTGLQKEIAPLLDTISKSECPNELRQLQSIVEQINQILANGAQQNSNEGLNKTKKEVADVLCDLLCF